MGVVILFGITNFCLFSEFAGPFSGNGYSEASATNYYFSSKNGKDSNTGKSSGSPWQSMAKLNQTIPLLTAGDVIYFERGSEWENVNVSIQNISGTKSAKIVFTTYGTGAKPRFRGSKTLTSFTQSGSLWSKTEPALPVYNAQTNVRVIPFVYVNGKKYDCSRFPNTGYLTASTGGVTNYLTDNSQNWGADYWKNGMVTTRYLNWRWTTRKINSNNATMLYFDEMDRTFERDQSVYLIRNHINACDLNGEWVQQNESLSIRWDGNLNNQKVEVPVSHTIFNIQNAKYLVFDGLQIERAVVYNIQSNASNLEILNCTIADAGGMLVYAENHSDIKTLSNAFTGGRRGGVYYYESKGIVSKNTFKQMYFDGIDNTEHTYGACIASWHCDGNFYSEYNRMDSINLGYNMHWSHDSVWIQRNYITNFGFTVRDAAAIYFGADFTGPAHGAVKFVNNNILVNAINDYVHGLYLDSNSNYITCDSNTIVNTNLAVFIHVSHDNTVKNTKIVNPAKDMKVYAWNQAIRLDEYSFKYGEGTAVTNNKITDNLVVLGETANEDAVFLLNISNIGSNTINRNRYIDPFGTDAVLFGICQDYSQYKYYSLADWSSMTGQDAASKHQISGYAYNSGSGIPKNKFVKVLYNLSNQTARYDLRNLDGYYANENGVPAGDFIDIAPYYSVVLFYQSARNSTSSINAAPIINDQFFALDESMQRGDLIGTLLASDGNAEQQLHYSISSGNENGLFTLDPYRAELKLNFEPDYNTEAHYVIGVTVRDDGSPSMTASAEIQINQIKRSNAVYIDPDNMNDPLEDGSASHPFDAWSDVRWTDGGEYLQKKGTEAGIAKINIGANAVSMGAYGEGDMPVIVSTADDFVFTAFEKNNITIRDLEIRGESAVSLVYFLGATCNNNIIEGCRFSGAENGIRIMDGENFIIRYNEFTNHTEAVYSYAQNTELYYNVFHNNTAAIDIRSYLSNTQIYNNVFYGNGQSLITSYSDIVLYNNIFYLTNEGDKAIQINPEKIVSDHNIFFPEQTGFITINGRPYNTLAEYQQEQVIDINSICQDPMFVDPSNANFKLQSSSPGIDAGKELMALKQDISGLKVPAGEGTDIGAQETKSGADESLFAASVDVFPNPSSGVFEVSFQIIESLDAIIDVFDLYGKKVLSEVLPSMGSGEFRQRFDISHVPSGMYLVKVIMGSEILSSRLVIQ
jgi:parallel beta-helix repeat protein